MRKEELKELIISNQRLIYSIIHKFKGQDIEDLFQAGCLGLINAYNNYDSKYNTKFSTYAYPYIVGEVVKYISNNRSIRLHRDSIKLYQSFTRAQSVLESTLGRHPTDNEICTFLEIDMYKLWEIRNAISVESLDYEYDNGKLYDVISIENLSKDQLIDLKDAIGNLTKEEQQFIIKRYFYNISQQQLADYYNTNQAKISREEKRILCKLKAKMY